MKQTIRDLTGEQLWLLRNAGIQVQVLSTFQDGDVQKHQTRINMKNGNVDQFFKGKLARKIV